MAEERNLGLARAPEQSYDTDATKAELQRRMGEARESITQTVTEIKETVVNQYQQVKESISDTLDWREQYRRRPVPFTVGAFGAGLLLGYSVAGAFKGDPGEEDEDFDAETDAAFRRIEGGFDRMKEGGPQRSYAASPIIGAAHSGGAYQRTSRPETNADTEAAEVFGGQEAHGFDSGQAGESGDVGPSQRPSYSSGYQAATARQAAGLSWSGPAGQAETAAEEEQEPGGPSLLERFKGTKAYDRLQDELSTLGDRALEELSKTARNVVLPALLTKLKDMIGIDLSGQRGGARQQQGSQPSQTGAAGEGAGGGTTAAGSAAYATGGTGTV